MPIYDRQCQTCNRIDYDLYEKMTTVDPVCPCGGVMGRVLLKSNNVISDECDITIKHGLCNPDGTPRHYDHKSDIAKEARRRNLTNLVEHKGTRGSDKSPHTVKWY